MKKAIVVSDTHGNNTNFHKVMKLHPDAMCIIHCGDVEGGEEDIRTSVSCPVYMVAGNNDYFNDLPREIEEYVFGRRIFVTHGHNYRVSVSPEMIRQEGVARDCDVVFYGHTHHADSSYEDGLLIVNPGALSDWYAPRYAIVDVADNGVMVPSLCVLSAEQRGLTIK